MRRGRDLTDPERAFVHQNKIMQNWDSKLRQIKEGGRKKILEACVNGGVRVSEATVKRIAREAKCQEEESEKHFLNTGEVKGMDHSASRKGKRGRISKLTEQVKEVYREIISRYAFSWTRLSEAKLWEELKKNGLNFSMSTVHEHLKLLKKDIRKSISNRFSVSRTRY